MTSEKSFDPTIERRSIVDTPSVEERVSPSAHPIIISVAQASQTITPWGVDPKYRDKQLRSFWISEPWLASVVYSVSIRNASFVWEIRGADPAKPTPKNTAKAVEHVLKQSNKGKGWKNLIVKTCIDLFSQDNGAVWQIIRAKDRPDAPVINISHLDAGQCVRTGDPEYPIIYTDRKGRERVMRWWQIRTIEEFPSPIENALDMQYSAVSRCLLAAEIIQSISVYKQEKVGGTFTKAIDAVSGITQQNIDDALAIAQEQNMNKGLFRFSLPVIVPGIDPTSPLSHIHIDLASLPDNFNEDTSFKWYVAQLAAAFGVDYQEIAPLMTGNLGSSQQSEIMHLKTRGKGPAVIMGIFEGIINDGLIPKNVEFAFLEQDLRSETEKAEARFTRAKDRAMRLQAGELDPKAARQVAIKDGDLPAWLAEEIDARQDELMQEQAWAEEQSTKPEFSPSQVTGGIASQETKALTMADVTRIRRMISEHPFDLLSQEIDYALDNPKPAETREELA